MIGAKGDIVNGETKKDIPFDDSCLSFFLGRAHHFGHKQVVLREHQEDLTVLREKQVHTFVDDTITVARVLQKLLKTDKLKYELFGNRVPPLLNILPRFRTDSDFKNSSADPFINQPYTHRIMSKRQLQQLKDELNKIANVISIRIKPGEG